MPVLSYTKVDRADRYMQSLSVNGSQSSSGESGGNATGNSNNSGTSNTGRTRRQSTSRTLSRITRQRSNSTAGARRGSSASASPPPVLAGDERVRIEDYCFGTPKKVNQSHSGHVELYISTQEKAVFLPVTRGSRRRRRHHHHHGQHGASANGSAQAAQEEDYVRPPPEPEPSAGRASGSQDSARDSGENDADDDDDETNGSDNHHNGNGSSGNDGIASGGLDLHTGGINDNNEQQSPSTMLRGSVLLKLQKPTRIKEIGVTFYSVSRTLWNLLPQPALLVDSSLPNNAQVEDVAYLGVHHWDFVPLEQFGPAQAGYEKTSSDQSASLIGQDLYGADVAVFKDRPDELQQRRFLRVHNNSACRLRGVDSHQVPVFAPLSAQPRKLKQNTVQGNGVVFPAGEYVYNFTLLVDAKTPGSVNVPNGQVKFVLGAKVVRAGTFTPNVSGRVDIDVVGAPDAFADWSGSGPGNDAVLLSRVWDDRFVYSVNIERRNITLDVPTTLTLTLLPLAERGVMVHQVQVLVFESVSYVYSLDSAIRYVDSGLELLMFQRDAPTVNGRRAGGSLLHDTEPTKISTKLLLSSPVSPRPKDGPQAYTRGKFGELRFLEPDVRGPYIRVKHRLMVVLRVSRDSPESPSGRSHFEVKIDTPICVLSRHCVAANMSLPSYAASGEGEQFGEAPPSFDDAMEHQLLGPSGAPQANPRGSKAVVQAVTETAEQ